MTIQNVEIKAYCSRPDKIRAILEERGADYRGTDHQIDTYFNVDEGRLKLREGNIENNLIFYRRSDIASPKRSDIQLAPVENGTEMKTLLTAALGVKTIVDKQREIYFIDNVKFHIDDVQELGTYVEIEAIDEAGTIEETELRKQCDFYIGLFEIAEADLVAQSYSDLVNQK